MDWNCELPLRPHKHFLVPAAGRELTAMVKDTPVRLDIDPDDVTKRPDELGAVVGSANSEGMVIGADGWPRVKVICKLDDEALPHSVREALAAGTAGVGFDGKVSTHHCKGDDKHTMIGGFNELNGLCVVPLSAEPVKGGAIDELPRLQ